MDSWRVCLFELYILGIFELNFALKEIGGGAFNGATSFKRI